MSLWPRDCGKSVDLCKSGLYHVVLGSRPASVNGICNLADEM
jgi:hypothetical protein